LALRQEIVSTQKEINSLSQEDMLSLQALMDQLNELEAMISNVMKAANVSAASIQSALKSS